MQGRASAKPLVCTPALVVWGGRLACRSGGWQFNCCSKNSPCCCVFVTLTVVVPLTWRHISARNCACETGRVKPVCADSLKRKSTSMLQINLLFMYFYVPHDQNVELLWRCIYRPGYFPKQTQPIPLKPDNLLLTKTSCWQEYIYKEIQHSLIQVLNLKYINIKHL